MKRIKFTYDYNKFNSEHRPTPKTAILIEVFLVDTKDLHNGFIEYDTTYFDTQKNDWANYKLPKGKVLVLLFRSYGDFMWTTIRRYLKHKYLYYMNSRGEEFRVVIGDE